MHSGREAVLVSGGPFTVIQAFDASKEDPVARHPSGAPRAEPGQERRKTIVFLPGAFGSQINLPLPDGRTLGFPDFYDEAFARSVPFDPQNPTTDMLPQLAEMVNQKIGRRKCI